MVSMSGRRKLADPFNVGPAITGSIGRHALGVSLTVLAKWLGTGDTAEALMADDKVLRMIAERLLVQFPRRTEIIFTHEERWVARTAVRQGAVVVLGEVYSF